MSISAVIPAHNEESTVGKVVEQCVSYCDEVIVVDDGSSDRTGEVAVAAGATVIRNPINLGTVKSVEIGLRTASKEMIVTLDADGQHDPSQIPLLIAPISQGVADLVLGKRLCELPFSEHVISTLTRRRVNCEDVGSSFRAIRRDLALRMHLWGFCLCGSLILEAQEHGARIVEVPITLKRRAGGKSHWPSPFARGTMHSKQAVLLAWHLAYSSIPKFSATRHRPVNA